MVKQSKLCKTKESDVSDLFAALGDPTRHRIVHRIMEKREGTLTDISQMFSMSDPALLKHLRILEDSGILQSEKRGRSRYYTVLPETMTQGMEWFSRHEKFWKDSLDRLSDLMEERAKQKSIKT